MTENERIIFKTIGHEGGYVNDSDDAGGETKYGISKRSYPHLDIATLTEKDAVAIYTHDYLNALEVPDEWPLNIRWKLFDVAVNMGLTIAKKFRDTIAGEPSINKLVELQMKRYVEITVNRPANLKFLKGWTNRAFDIGEDLL